MNIEKIIQEARIKWGLPDNSVKVTVAASAEKDISMLLPVLRDWAEKSHGKWKIITSGSFGYFDLEPIVIVEKPGYSPLLHARVTEDAVCRLIRDYILDNNQGPDAALCTLGSENWKDIPASTSLSLFKFQNRIATRNCGLVDPEDINHYVAEYEGYTGLSRALEMSQIEVVEELRRSCLSGRRGAGNLTADKWKIIQDAQGDQKYVICNAIDNDVRSQTARLFLGGDPHSVLEGMLIAAYGAGASRCIVAVGTGNDFVVEKLMKALTQMMEYGLLGEAILGSDFDCSVEIREVVPSLVLSEDTALLSLLEGRQAIPYLWNPCDAPLFQGKPALVENVETLANVSAIFQEGTEWFSSTGKASSKGSKVISLSGAVVHRYTVEVPLETTFDDIIYEIGGGVPDGRSLKAIRLGGPAGTYFSADDHNLTLDCCDPSTAGPLLRSGAIDVIADDACVVEMTDNLIEYIQTQSCGKCIFCREGTIQISEILKDVVRGESEARDLELLTELAEAMKASSLCDLGRNAGNQVLSSIKLFSREYNVHIKEKKCPYRS